MNFNKGERIKVIGNSIFECMGLGRVVTGTVFMVLPTGNLSIRCDQTGALELVEIGDGEIERTGGGAK